MSILVQQYPHLPPFPFIVNENSRYVLQYNGYNQYILYHFWEDDTSRSYTFDRNGYLPLDSPGFYGCVFHKYTLNSPFTTWQHGDGVLLGLWKNNIIASSFDLYNADGTIAVPRTFENYFNNDNLETFPVIAQSITPSTIMTSLSDVRYLLPMLIIVIVGFIAFRKAWDFIKGAIRGA